MRLSGVKWVCGCVRLSGVGRKMNEKMRMSGWERKEEVNGWLGVWGCVGVCGGVWGCVGGMREQKLLTIFLPPSSTEINQNVL